MLGRLGLLKAEVQKHCARGGMASQALLGLVMLRRLGLLKAEVLKNALILRPCWGC